jgi:DNA-binding CsgD family transcriptional regulator
MVRVAATTVLERERPLGAARRLMHRVVSGGAGALFLIGEAGLGKTTLLDRISAMARARSVSVSMARGDPMEVSLAHGLTGQLVAGLGLDTPDPPTSVRPEGDRRAAYYLSVLRTIQDARTGPLLLAVDDLHWADPDSLELVAFLTRRLDRLNVGVAMTLRPWPPEAQEVVRALQEAGHASIERLGPLSPESASRLLSASVGAPVDDDVAERTWRLCAGNPLLLEQVAAQLRSGEVIPEAIEGSAASRLPERLLLGRFAALPDDGVRCARGASVLGSPFRIDVAAAVAGLDDLATDRAADALLRSGILRTGGDGVAEFAHPLLRQALYADLTPPTRQRLHARAFEVLRDLGRESDAAEQAIQGELVGHRDSVEILERVGRSALARGAIGSAARLLEGAVRLAGDRASPELLRLAGEALLSAGAQDSTLATLEQLVRHPSADTATRGHALRLMARARWLRADFDAAAAHCEEAVELTRHERPELAVEVLLDQALVLGYVCRTAESLDMATRAVELAREAGAAATGRAHAIWGQAALLAGDPSGMDAMAAAARQARPPSHVAGAWGWSEGAVYATAARYVERFDDAERLMGLALEGAERSGAPGMICSTATVQADTLLRTGRLAEARRLAELATSLADIDPVVEAHAWATLAAVLWAAGDLRGSEACCERAERVARQRGQVLALLQVCDVRGRCRLAAGRFDEARAVLLQAEQFTSLMGLGEPCVVPWAGNAITAHMRSGHEEDAGRLLEWLDACAARLPCRWPRIAASRGRALLAERGGDHPRATAEYEAALALHGQVQLPLERLFTLLEYGAFLRRSGQLQRARTLLGDAARAASAIGAGGIADAALGELRAAGGRRRRRAEPERLTVQEERIARLAAEGRTNREIARLMSLSLSTVKTHLERSFAKLEVRSRRELARAWLRYQEYSHAAAEEH